MENLILFGIIMLILYLISKSDGSGIPPEIKDNGDLPGDRFKDHEEQEEMFYHPVTGYKGTRSEMDAYIVNREKKLGGKS